MNVTGRINPNELYALEGVTEGLGVGEEKIDELRDRGLPVYRDGKRIYFKGSEVIEAVLKGAKREVRN
jgi:hypothetical protein